MSDDDDNDLGVQSTNNYVRLYRSGASESVEIDPSEVPFAVTTLARAIDRDDVLTEAWGIATERGQKYGHPGPNMEACARLWDAYVKNQLAVMGAEVPDEPVIEAPDVAQMMVNLKQSRIQTGEPNVDNGVDGAGYFRVWAEVEDFDDE